MHKSPSDHVSDETTDRHQIDLAKAQGDAYDRALKELTQEVAHGAETRSGSYIVGWAAENAEGLYRRGPNGLEWHEPREEENAHLEITVRDGADGRFIPCLRVTATLYDPDGNEVGTHEQPFLWHPWVYHYGRNWVLPVDGTYRLKVHVDPPDFMVHDRANGKRYADGVDVEFGGVEIRRGRK